MKIPAIACACMIWAGPAWVRAAESPPPAADPVPPGRAAEFERAVARFNPPKERTGVRELFDFALEASAAGWRPEAVERALEIAEQMQDRDPSSRTLGNFRWYWFNEKPGDLNAVEFSMERAALVWKLHRDRLTPGARGRLERLITFAIEGIRRHGVAEAYTNIFLMKTWNCIAIGEATGRADLADEGYRMLERWLTHAWESGIHEYLSPTYYGVDAHCLGLMARFAGRPEGRRLAEAALRLFWTDIAANWYAPAQRLGGAHSRDYDYLTGRGHLDLALRRQGWLSDGNPVETSAFNDLAAWTPPDDIRALAERKPRFVRQRWGTMPWETAAQHVGRIFSLGSAGATYWNMDKPLVLNLPGGITTPAACFFMDGRNDPYGRTKIPEGASGHTKALHLNPFLASVQRGPEVLLVASADPANKRHFQHQEDATGIWSQFFFPTNASVWETESQAPLPLEGRRVLAGDRPVFLRSGDAAAGIRFVARIGCDGKAAPVALVADGGRFGAARLTVEHATTKPAARGVVGVWVRAAEGLDDAAFAAFRRGFAAAAPTVRHEGDRLDITAPGCAGPLRVAVDLAREERLAIEGAEPGAESALLAVDGRDLGREIVGNVGPVAHYRKVLEAAEKGGTASLECNAIIQAEAAQALIGDIAAASDPTASGGRFVWAPEIPNAQSSGGGRALWLIRIPRAGRYSLWGRVLAPTAEDDSFFVRMEQPGTGRPPVEIEWHTGVHPAWTWTRVASRDVKAGQSAAFELNAGVLRLEFRGRERGAKLDALFLSDKASGPPGDQK